jgi:hypothetical protein
MLVTPIVETNILKTSKIDSYESISYARLEKIVEGHHYEVIEKKDVTTTLFWVHIIISNAKRLIFKHLS